MAWFHHAGAEQDIVLGTRVSLARNLSEYPFPARLDATAAREILSKIGGVLEQNGFTKTDFADISRTMAHALAEQQYVTPAFVKESIPHALFQNEPCHLSAMVCGEDHVQVQAILPGLALRDAYEAAHKIERLLDERFDLAFDERLGYLTQSPGELGTAMRPSVILCLPLLAEARLIGDLSVQLNRLGLRLDGLYGEEVHAPGFLYRLTPHSSLGLTEEDALCKMENAVLCMLEKERSQRKNATGVDQDALTDRILRAEAILRHAHMLPARESLGLLADVRLGVAMGLVTSVLPEVLTALLIETMPATLTLSSPTPVTTDRALDLYRATVVKEKLQPTN